MKTVIQQMGGAKAALTVYTRRLGRVLAKENIVMSAVLLWDIYVLKDPLGHATTSAPFHKKRATVSL